MKKPILLMQEVEAQGVDSGTKVLVHDGGYGGGIASHKKGKVINKPKERLRWPKYAGAVLKRQYCMC